MREAFSILALDFHNTIYDEVMEYGLAIDEVVTVWIDAAARQGKKLARKSLYQELSIAHRDLGSDWDEEVWRRLPSLKNLEGFNEIFDLAVKSRQDKSKELTIAGAFEKAVETLKRLKSEGVRIYIITEAAADAGLRGIVWLGLGGIIDGVYTYPSREAPEIPTGTYHQPFPVHAENPSEHLKKPHPFVLAQVVLDDAKTSGKIPHDVMLEDVFETLCDKNLALPEFPFDAAVQRDITARLSLKPGPYQAVLQETLNAMIYVGDSKFKDGFLARNAGVTFGYAAYGKKIKSGTEALFNKSQEILYAVTGWNKEALRLTQEAGKSAAVSALQPDFTFEDSLAEVLLLFKKP